MNMKDLSVYAAQISNRYVSNKYKDKQKDLSKVQLLILTKIPWLCIHETKRNAAATAMHNAATIEE